MNYKLHSKIKNKSSFIVVLTILIITLGFNSQVFSHGGKNHAENEFTSFSALNMAVTLYGQLLMKNKLMETWETDLVKINISTRVNDGENEFVVSFEKASGDPNKVFIFYDAKGNYTGSNFTGD